MYGVVTRVSFGLAAFPVRCFSPASCGFDSWPVSDPDQHYEITDLRQSLFRRRLLRSSLLLLLHLVLLAPVRRS